MLSVSVPLFMDNRPPFIADGGGGACPWFSGFPSIRELSSISQRISGGAVIPLPPDNE